MTRYLLDSDMALYAMTGVSDALRAHLERCAPGDVGMSTISFAVLSVGTVAGKPPAQHVLDAFIATIPLLDFGADAALAYAHLPFKRARFDRLLAAHALSIDAVIVTNNEADFADVPDLRIENWTR